MYGQHTDTNSYLSEPDNSLCLRKKSSIAICLSRNIEHGSNGCAGVIYPHHQTKNMNHQPSSGNERIYERSDDRNPNR